MNLTTQIKERAKQLEFDRVGIAPAKEATHADQYLDWLSEGRHGEMHYLDKYHDQRANPSVMTKGAKTAVVLLKNYYQEDHKLAGGLKIARYAQGDDYHDILWARMRELASYIHAETGADVATRPATDTAPVLERDLAQAAGLGWIGKNAMLINPEIGSYVFISEILVDLELETDDTEVPDRCGTCSNCIDACPTNAITSPYVIDARRCISYLTIELRGPIPRHLRPQIGDHVFGCDICQEVCPWNNEVEATEDPVFQTREKYRSIGPENLLQFDMKDYQQYFSKSAMKRAKPVGLRRNAAVVLGNTGTSETVEPLVEQYRRDDEPLVRGHIAWALGEIGGESAEDALCEFQKSEKDSYVLEEIRVALS
jgi:epoxyqueuosine reductase